ncbi:hypothetical protein RB200_29050 [Streptomyces sp. PmtG]
MTEHVFINRESGKCVTLVSAETAAEGGRMDEENCRITDGSQRFHVYQDVPGSGLIGPQNKLTGFMAGQSRVTDNEIMRQYSTGNADGTGTYLLEKIT